MIVISKNKFFDKLVGVVNKYNNTYHRKISMKPVGIKGGIYIYLFWLWYQNH